MTAIRNINVHLASYANKHIEKKVRAIDGYWNPHVRYTLKDYKNFKATMGFGDGIGKPGEFDPESKNEKVKYFIY